MTRNTIFAAIALSLTAGAALAQSVSPGAAQLAAQAGVSPGLYSQTQLIRLIEAKQHNQDNEVAFILANPEGPVAVTRGAASASSLSQANAAGVNAGVTQLALEAGVQPGLYSQAQLISLIEAQRDNQDNLVLDILANPQGPLAG